MGYRPGGDERYGEEVSEPKREKVSIGGVDHVRGR